MDSTPGTCQECDKPLPAAAVIGRPRRYCSATCRSAARRARRREAARITAIEARHCSMRVAGRSCGHEVEFALVVDGEETRICATCYEATLSFLIGQGVPATSVETIRLVPLASGPATDAAAVPGAQNQKRLLLVEDDTALTDMLQIILKAKGYRVTVEHDGLGGLRQAYAQRPDLVLLDLMLPAMSGFEVLRRLRAVSDVPVIVVTAKSDIDDRIVGLTSGADDYVVKPFDVGELLARIARALQRHHLSHQWVEEIYDDGLLRLDSTRQEAHAAGRRLDLTAMEFRLLELLARNADAVQPLDKILAKVWSDPGAISTERVKFTVSRLRRKLEGTTLGSASIVSARGIGYLYRPQARRANTSSPGGYGHSGELLNILDARNEKS